MVLLVGSSPIHYSEEPYGSSCGFIPDSLQRRTLWFFLWVHPRFTTAKNLMVLLVGSSPIHYSEEPYGSSCGFIPDSLQRRTLWFFLWVHPRFTTAKNLMVLLVGSSPIHYSEDPYSSSRILPAVRGRYAVPPDRPCALRDVRITFLGIIVLWGMPPMKIALFRM